ncbi:MAG: N-acetylmuramoyl-L-alanine amidase [Acidobacteriota bacterium]
MHPSLKSRFSSAKGDPPLSIRVGLAVVLALMSPVPSAAAPSWSLSVSGHLHPIRSANEGDHIFLHLGDVARAVGGDWGREPNGHAYLLTLEGNTVLFRRGRRRIAVNGRRRSLRRPLLEGEQGVYVPVEFVRRILPGLVAEPLELKQSIPSRTGSEGPAAGEEAGPPGWEGPGGAGIEFPGEAVEAMPLHEIVLDPGHGGPEEGGRGPTGLLEKDVTLEVCRRLRTRLEYRGYKVLLTREGDLDLSLDERTALANNNKADLFISIHVNASPSSRARGAETYYLSLDRAARDGQERKLHSDDGKDRTESNLKMILWDMAQTSQLRESSLLAESIQEDFNRVLQLPDRGVKQAPLRVLVGALMPAVLVEIGFISNPEEEIRLQDPLFLDQIVDSLARSIEVYRFRAHRLAPQEKAPGESGSYRGGP